MYPSSSSSSSQGSMGPNTGGGLFRYGSAPGSLLTTAVDSVIGATREFSALGSQSQSQSQSPLARRYFSAAAETSSVTAESKDTKDHNKGGPPSLQKCYGRLNNDIAVGDFPTASNNNLKSGGWSSSSSSSSSSPSLVRHSSSPPGFLNHLASNADNGFSLTTGIGGYNSSKGASENGRIGGISRLNSQLSFTRQDSLSQISEESENVVDNNGNRRNANSYATASFGMGSWDDSHTNAITFAGSPSKRAKNIDTVESQFQFGLPHTMLEMVTMENLQQIPQDSVPCRIRAKRGCATHPRSIAERERRTRISGKLKKLQDLVPNMDKQTSYSDMLDLAVQHIKGLQNQVQKLNHELENCKCGCNQTT